MNNSIRVTLVVLMIHSLLISVAFASPQNNGLSNKFQINGALNSLTGTQTNLNNVTRPDNKLKRRYKTTNPGTSAFSLNNNQLKQNLKLSLQNNNSTKIAKKRQKVSLNNLASLSLSSGGLNSYFDKNNGTPTFLQGVLSEPPANTLAKPGLSAIDKKQIARQFLRDNKNLLKLNDPDTEFTLLKENNGNEGKKHLIYQQQFNGVPLWGKQAAVHINENNQVYLFNGRYNPSLYNMDVTPVLSAEEALAVVKSDLNTTETEVLSNQLNIWFDENEKPVLVYSVDVKPSIADRWIYFVNANTAGVEHRIRNIHNAGSSVNASGVDLDGNTHNFKVWQENNTFVMIDPTFPTAEVPANPLKAPSNKGDMYILDAQNGDGNTLDFVQSTNANSGWDRTAVSALSNTLAVYNYFLNTYNRKSFDDNNKNLMVAIHMDKNFNNAFWNGTFMVYGDGDNKIFGPLASCLDVAGHEMSHGVIEHTANLIYQNQSGALNESFADVFGAMVDRDDWLMGENCTVASPGYLRNMQNPAKGLSPQPGKMSEYKHLPNTEQGDNGGVHVNSGIPNRAAYLVAEGLSVEGRGTSVGRDKLEQIWYKALKDYLTASAQFIDARRATIQAAKDLYGANSAEELAVIAAWDLVEVTEDSVATPDSKTPTKTDVVTGEDYMVYLWPLDNSDDGNPDDRFDVYRQRLVAPDYIYSQDNDSVLNSSVYAAYTRPAAYTDADGSIFFYVGLDSNLYAADGGGQDIQITDTGDIWSIAISPDGRYFAYTAADPTDKSIHVLDLTTEDLQEITIPLTPPDYQQGGQNVANLVYYADSLAFDYTGNLIVFDALNCVSIPDSPCGSETGGGIQYWSIGIAEVASAQIFYPFPSQDPMIDLGYPGFASTTNAVIVLDMQDYTQFESDGILSKVISINFETQQIADVFDFGYGGFDFWGVPSFWGDDSAVTISVYNSETGSVGGRVPVDSNYVGIQDNAIEINPGAVAMPVMHRAGVRQLSGTLFIDKLNIDLGSVSRGETPTQQIKITNNGNRDVEITNIVISGSAFTHNMTNTVIPRNATLTGTVALKPTAKSGAQNSTITLTTDGDPASIQIQLTANISGGGGGSDDGPFGCSLSTNRIGFDPLFLILITLSGIFLMRKNISQRVSRKH